MDQFAVDDSKLLCSQQAGFGVGVDVDVETGVVRSGEYCKGLCWYKLLCEMLKLTDHIQLFKESSYIFVFVSNSGWTCQHEFSTVGQDILQGKGARSLGYPHHRLYIHEGG